MLHDGFFWATIVLGLILLGVVVVVGMLLFEVQRDNRRAQSQEARVGSSREARNVEILIKWEPNLVRLRFPDGIEAVRMDPFATRTLAAKLQESADKAELPRGPLKTSWERLRDLK